MWLALVAWLASALVTYLALPIAADVSEFGLFLLLSACLGSALTASTFAVIRAGRARALWVVIGVVVIGAVVAYGSWAGRPMLYVKSQFALQRGALAELASDFNSGQLPPDAELP